MKVLFAPDWRAGVPYQRLLAEALLDEGVEVAFFRHYYKRGLPLSRLLSEHQRQAPCDLLHLHWPEAYYPRKEDGLDWFRMARYSMDLALASRSCPLVLTAHNLRAHNREASFFEDLNYALSMKRAKRIFAHSPVAQEELAMRFSVPRTRICVIPPGDLSVNLEPPMPREEARAALGLQAKVPICLLFGAVEPYKGIEGVLKFWREHEVPARLVIAGKPYTASYGEQIKAAAAGYPSIQLDLQWLDDLRLRLWFSASDAVVFNYRSIFTSGAAALARSYGLPILLPERLRTVDLQEPHPSVFRFESFDTNFDAQLRAAIEHTPRYAAAGEWRASTSWKQVARITADAYRTALG